jgi:hypothetical protein
MNSNASEGVVVRSKIISLVASRVGRTEFASTICALAKHCVVHDEINDIDT